MKIVRPICCGMDVHKNIIVATIGITNKKTRITEYIQETFSTLNPDLLNLKQWLINHKCFDACMESTGKYWIPIFNILEDEINIYLTHPKYVKAIKGKKTDKKDSKWICDLFKHDLIKFSFIPPKEIRALREISRYRYKLVGMRSSERNRYQNCMTVSNIGIGSVFSDPFGKSAQAIMKEVLLESDIIEDEKILKCIHGSCKNKDKILDSIKHCNIETDQRFKMNESMIHMEELQVHIDNCEIEIMKRAAPMFDQFMHITQLPGISTLSAILIISEIGVDMKQFESDKQLTCWGLAPANNESANKKKSVRISKAGQYLKPLLVQCALGAIKDKEGYFGIKYSRIKKRRGHKKAIIAIARMMLVSIYHMILTGETFNPSDYESFRNPKPPIKQQDLTEESAIEFLKKSGFDVSKLTKP